VTQNDVILSLIFGVGILISIIDMAYQQYTTGHVDQKAAVRWVWRTVSAAAVFFLVHAVYQLATIKH
jgi:hypothetical protein